MTRRPQRGFSSKKSCLKTETLGLTSGSQVHNGVMKISMDFDDTLSMSDNSPNPLGIFHFHNHVMEGHEIIIVTSRHESEASKDAIHGFLRKHNLPVSDVIHTNGELKVETLVKQEVSIHHDDDKRELEALQGTGIQGVNCFNKELFTKLWIEEFGQEPDEGFDD